MKLLITLLLLFFTASLSDDVTTRFSLPSGFTREYPQVGSFGQWLQQLKLKPAGTPTRTYNGDVARTNLYTAAVVDMSVGKYDLQQCADAVIRLRAEYLFHLKKFNQIAFNFTSGFRCDYVHYANGYQYSNDHWKLKAAKDYSYNNFLQYLNLVFSYAGTLSLEKELKKVNNQSELKAGDVFIHGGSPGHCFIVMEVIQNRSHQKKFLLAQSFMPAQNIQVLQFDGSPWFSLDKPSDILYGELINMKYLKKFD